MPPTAVKFPDLMLVGSDVVPNTFPGEPAGERGSSHSVEAGAVRAGLSQPSTAGSRWASSTSLIALVQRRPLPCLRLPTLLLLVRLSPR